MFQKKILLLLTIISLSSTAFATTNYVSDELFAYTHNGPGTKYKIMGLVLAGEEIEVLSTDETDGYTQIKDKKGRSVWMDSKHVSNQPGLKKQLEKLRISADKANDKIINLETNLNSNINQVIELKKTNLSLSSQLKEVQEINESLTDKVDNEKNELLMQWFSYGGMVGGIGLLLGLILPALFPSRKKKSSW
jgi:SH3 domain protein